MKRTIGKVTTLALACCAVSSVLGCSGEGSNAQSHENTEAVGTVGLALQLPSGTSIDSATYTITGPKDFTKTGTIDVHDSTKLTATIPGIPAGNGYKITISALASDEAT